MNKEQINTACPSAALCKLGDILEDLQNETFDGELTKEQISALNTACPAFAKAQFGTQLDNAIKGETVDTDALKEIQCPAKIAQALLEIVEDSEPTCEHTLETTLETGIEAGCQVNVTKCTKCGYVQSTDVVEEHIIATRTGLDSTRDYCVKDCGYSKTTPIEIEEEEEETKPTKPTKN